MLGKNGPVGILRLRNTWNCKGRIRTNTVAAAQTVMRCAAVSLGWLRQQDVGR
jgi:hypothetical protein